MAPRHPHAHRTRPTLFLWLCAWAAATLPTTAAAAFARPRTVAPPPPLANTPTSATRLGLGTCLVRNLWFHAGAFYALAPPASLSTLRACLGPSPTLAIALLPTADVARTVATLHSPAWLPGRAAALAAPSRYEPPPHTALDTAGAWVVSGLAVSDGNPVDALLVAGADRAGGGAAGAAAAALSLRAPAQPSQNRLAALFRDDLVSLAAGGWLGLEAVVVPVGPGEGGGHVGRSGAGAGAGALAGAVRARVGAAARVGAHVLPAAALPPAPAVPSLILFAPARPARLTETEALVSALSSAAAASGLAFRLVDGGRGGEGGSTTPTAALAAVAPALAGARVIVGRGAPDLAAIAAAAPPGSSLLELVPVEGHPAVAAVVAARATSPTTALAAHALWSPHPPGGPVGRSNLAWADANDADRYGAWARPDCASAVLHGGDCAAAVARAGLVVRAGSDVASVVDAALRGLYAAEAAAGVGLSGNGRRGVA